MSTTKYPYLQIAVTVTDADGVPSDFSYNGAPMVTLPALAQISGMFAGLNDGYLMWETPDKRAYTYFRTGKENNPELSITIMLDADILIPGRPLTALLTDVADQFATGALTEAEQMEELASRAGMPEEPLRGSEAITPAQWQHGTEMCYRTYTSTGELNNIFGFPRQEAYKPYRGVLVVGASVTAEPGTTIPQISTPVDKALMVVCPPDVSASAYRVSFSDHLAITYSCEGFDPVSVTFEVGTTNRYVRINGPALVVNSAYHAGIIFHRRIPYTVEAVGGTPIDSYTILINGRTANRTDEGFEVSNTDFANGPVKITVSSTGYCPFSQEFTPETLEESAPLNVVLQADSREVLLRMDFGNGRLVEEKLYLEKNAPEYCQLRAGDFHGFRAHRLMGTDTETYNIDVKPQGAVTLKDERKAEVTSVPEEGEKTEQPQGGGGNMLPPVLPLEDVHSPVAPRIEKAPTAIWTPKKTEVVTPTFTNETVVKDTSDDESMNKVPVITKLRSYITEKTVLITVTVLLGLIAIWVVASLISSSVTEDNPEAADRALVAPDTTAKNVSGGIVKLTPDEESDVAYLNSNSTWKPADLKSEVYKSLLKSMASGNIDEVVNHPYFTTKGQCSNKHANKMADYLWTAKGSHSESGNVKKLKAYASKDAIALRDLNEDLAKVRPTEPNTEPRPTKQ